MIGLNLHGVRAIYRFEMNRAFRTWAQSLIAPVLSTSLYFIVFGAAAIRLLQLILTHAFH